MKKQEIVTRIILTLITLSISFIWYKSAPPELDESARAGLRICTALFAFLGTCAAWGEGNGYIDGHHNP